jgi:hypothetical protein
MKCAPHTQSCALLRHKQHRTLALGKSCIVVNIIQGAHMPNINSVCKKTIAPALILLLSTTAHAAINFPFDNGAQDWTVIEGGTMTYVDSCRPQTVSHTSIF